MEHIAYIHIWKSKLDGEDYYNECELITSMRAALYQYDQQSTPDNAYRYTIRLDHTAAHFGAFEHYNILYDVIDDWRDKGQEPSKITDLENQAYQIDQALGVPRYGRNNGDLRMDNFDSGDLNSGDLHNDINHDAPQSHAPDHHNSAAA